MKVDIMKPTKQIIINLSNNNNKLIDVIHKLTEDSIKLNPYTIGIENKRV